MLISVVIPTCNRNDQLATCLESLAPGVQSTNKDKYEIIVSDDSTDDITKEIIDRRYPWVKWVEGSKKGPALNRNNGAKLANGEWLVFLDDDCVPQPSLLEAYSNAIQNNSKCLVFEGRIFADKLRQRMDEVAPLNETGGVLWSCNFMIKRALFEELKGFNEAFPYAAMEDVELFDRIKKVTITCFVREASVMHPWQIVRFPFQKFKQVYVSHKIYFTVNPEGKRRFALLVYSKLIIQSIFQFTLPDLVKYKGKGIKFPLAYHWFQLRILLYTFFSSN